MKKIFIALLLLLVASPVFGQTKKYGRDCARETSPADCSRGMDGIASSPLNTGDRCEIIDSNRVIAHYRYNAASSDAEDFPNVIAPDDIGAGNGRWELYRGDISGNIQFSVSDPENLPTQTAGGRGTKSIFVWYNDTGLTLNLEEIFAISDVDDYGFKLFKSTSRTNIGKSLETQIDAVQTTIGAAGQGYYDQETAFDSGTIEAGKFLIFEHDTGVGVGCQAVHVYIKGYLN